MRIRTNLDPIIAWQVSTIVLALLLIIVSLASLYNPCEKSLDDALMEVYKMKKQVNFSHKSPKSPDDGLSILQP